MKRFYKEVAVEEADGGYRVTLDGRPIRTQGGPIRRVSQRASVSDETPICAATSARVSQPSRRPVGSGECS